MSFFEDASLVLIPSAQKTSKVYSVKPTDGTGDLTFTRTGDTATRVGPDGLIEKVRTNLILQSEAFNVTWVPVRSSVTANTTTAPDGTSTADTLFDNTDANLHYVAQTFTAITGPATISVYAKANQLSQIQIVAQGGTTAMGRGFDLSTGTTFAESVGGVISNDLGQSITAVGNGWYRCTMSWTSTGQTSFWILTSYLNAATYTGTGTDGVFIWGAQLETGDIATDYIPTTTAAVSVGPVANVPRLDYLNSSCPRLLLEGQRQNVFTFSESFDNAAYTKVGGAVVANNSTSPDGYTNADTFTADGANSTHRLFQTFSATSGTTYTASFFVKKGTADFVQMAVSSGTAFGITNFANFDISTGVVGTSGGLQTNNTITDYGNGWYRISSTITAIGTATAQVDLCIIQAANSARLQSWTSSASVVLYGAQLEAGAYATSYIPTNSCSGACSTRGADAASKTGISSLIGQTEGVLYFEFNGGANDSVDYGISLSDGTTNNRIIIYRSTTNTLIAQIRTAATTVAQISTTTLTADATHKVAVGYANNDVVFYVNGVQIGTDTSAAIPATNRIVFDNGAGSTAQFYRPLNQLIVFPTRLSNADLAALTA